MARSSRRARMSSILDTSSSSLRSRMYIPSSARLRIPAYMKFPLPPMVLSASGMPCRRWPAGCAAICPHNPVAMALALSSRCRAGPWHTAVLSFRIMSSEPAFSWARRLVADCMPMPPYLPPRGAQRECAGSARPRADLLLTAAVACESSSIACLGIVPPSRAIHVTIGITPALYSHASSLMVVLFFMSSCSLAIAPLPIAFWCDLSPACMCSRRPRYLYGWQSRMTGSSAQHRSPSPCRAWRSWAMPRTY